MRFFRHVLVALAAAVALVAAGCDTGAGDDELGAGDEATPTATAGQEAAALRAQLDPLNESGAQGTATVDINDQSVTVTVQASGLSAGLPHAQHIHIGGANECPTPDVAGEDNLISTAEGIPAYGKVQVALTTSGDVSAQSALAVDRFPVAENGEISYSRTFDLPEGVSAEDVRNGVIVVHGIAKLSGDEAQYDGEARSSLDPNLPLEATIPALCGPLQQS